MVTSVYRSELRHLFVTQNAVLNPDARQPKQQHLYVGNYFESTNSTGTVQYSNSLRTCV